MPAGWYQCLGPAADSEMMSASSTAAQLPDSYCVHVLCRELRNVSGCSIHLSQYPDVPRCVKPEEEVRLERVAC